jgi:hypothetical protein
MTKRRSFTSEFKAKVALEARKAELLADRPETTPLRLHPRLAERFAEKVARLEEALEDPVDGHQAAEIIRGMIDRILRTPTQDGLLAELHGDLAVILAVCDEAESNKELPGPDEPGSQLSVVAGARNQRFLHIDHAFLYGAFGR